MGPRKCAGRNEDGVRRGERAREEGEVEREQFISFFVGVS